MKKIALLPFAFCLSSAASADLLISQYIEGSSNNKAIELYNTSDSAVDLGEYTLSFYFNGSTCVQCRVCKVFCFISIAVTVGGASFEKYFVLF